jgi:cold shock CspA family protein
MSKARETYSKKENEKKKQQKRKDKEQRKEERKAQSKEKGSWEDMMAYVDENGNISSTPPDPTRKKSTIKTEDIVIGQQKQINDPRVSSIRKGKVTFFNTSKGFGFIRDTETNESIFVHSNGLTTAVKENDSVTFETEKGFKGLVAVRVKLG